MEFLTLLRTEICHPEAVALLPRPSLYCQLCRKLVVEDLYGRIVQGSGEDHFRSSELAQAYLAWTGDEGVRMSFPLTHVRGIFGTVIRGQTARRVRQGTRLLRALNAPFTTEPSVERLPEMGSFLTDFLAIVHEHPRATESTERLVLDGLIRGMHDMLDANDPVHMFDTYYGTLVPYVQGCAGDAWQPLPATTEDSNWARELHLQLHRSGSVREAFGGYSLPFDVIHVMVCCYVCSSDLEVVGNWAMDFVARICRGEFFWTRFRDSASVRAMLRLVDDNVHYQKRADYYQRVVKPIRKGECAEHFSNLWQPLHELMALLRKMYRVPGLADPDLLDVAFAQLFPAVLFRDHADQLGYLMAYNQVYVSMNRRDGRLPKGIFKKARRIHEMVRRIVERVREFDRIRLDWTLETTKLFIARYEGFENELREMIGIVVDDDDGQE